MRSDIQVNVRFKEQGVFAGEEVRCTITFKNIANTVEDKQSPRIHRSRGWTTSASGADRSRSQRTGSRSPRFTAVQSLGSRKISRAGPQVASSPSTPLVASSHARSLSNGATTEDSRKGSHGHQRSVSIISLGSSTPGDPSSPAMGNVSQFSPPTKHRRAVSSQLYVAQSNTQTPIEGEADGFNAHQLPIRRASGLSSSAVKRLGDSAEQASTTTTSPLEATDNYRLERRRSLLPSSSQDTSPTAKMAKNTLSPSNNGHLQHGKPRGDAGDAKATDSPGQSVKTIATSSMIDSNRSSGDFQSLSNHSQETLASEQALSVPRKPMLPDSRAHEQQRPRQGGHVRATSTTRTKNVSRKLLMGYAHINATFTLDGSLVETSPFEEVKGQGFLGGQGGGGVVGVKPSSTSSGLLGGLKLNSIGESIGGLLGNTDISSSKEMKGVASSREIPLLSTPQTLLFVDLALSPGQEKTFFFRFRLPHGLPASYNGKAIKISYQLGIGVQEAAGDKSIPAVRRVNVPLRVFSGVDQVGQIYGHDLMQPHVLLDSPAHAEPVGSPATFLETASAETKNGDEEATMEFLKYVDTLLMSRRRRQSSSAAPDTPRCLIRGQLSETANDIINNVVHFGKQVDSAHPSSNRFNITRNSQRVATIFLERNSYRLGEPVAAIVDLSEAQLTTFSVCCSLETTEKINPALALRSAASLTRLSRKVYASRSESTLFAERVAFDPAIPLTATPTLLTSGVNLDWALRFEFITAKALSDPSGSPSDLEKTDLRLEEVATDVRGSTIVAVEKLVGETFEVSVPLMVYGGTVPNGTTAGSSIELLI